MRNDTHGNVKNVFLLYMSVMLCFVTSGCDGSKAVSKSTNSLGSELSTVEKDSSIVLPVEGLPLGYDNFRFIGNLEARFESDEEIECTDWLINSKNIKNILSDFEEVSGTEWGAKCYVYPCSYHGQVTNGQFEYNISINAASHVILARENKIIYFMKASGSPLFMQPCDCCE